MTDLHKFIRQHILDLPPYQPVFPLDVLSEELGIPIHQLTKLDANENPFGPLPEVKAALSEIEAIHIYPDPESRKIRTLLAKWHNIPEESIVIGAGADELIDLIMRIVLDPGDKIVNCPPTFGMYAFDSILNQAEVISVPRNPDFTLNIPALIAAVDQHQPKLLFLANPNNPDGGMITEEDYKQIINLPILVVLDEAYIQFSTQGETHIPKVFEVPNLIVLRTFSKWAGLAGLRIGYGVFPQDFYPVFMKAKQPYNVSIAAETAATVTMQHLPMAEDRIGKIIEQRNWLFEELVQLPNLTPYPTQANFILCKVLDGSARQIWEQLRKQGILIRYFDKPGLSDHIRISIGTEQQNQYLLSTLKGILE
jgi:histidinol-phosphate aminotransferase